MPRTQPTQADTHLAPSVLIILLDTATAELLSCYGRYKNTTPRLDRLAGEGMRFANAYTSGPWTPPSHAALFSGLPSIANGISHDAIDCDSHVMYERCRWRGRFPTMASTLAENGYDTVGVCANNWVGSRSDICWGFQTWVEDTARAARLIQERTGEKPHRHAATTNLLHWMRTRRRTGRPFFAFVNYATTHLKRTPLPQFESRFIRGEVKPYLKEITSLNCFEYLWSGKLKKRDMPAFVKLYVALAAQVDWEIEELLSQMEQRALLDNTVIFLVSDHGDENGEHGLLDHQLCVYNTLIHIPMIAWCPGRIPAGVVVENNAQMLDTFPTVLDLVGLHQVRERLALPGVNLVTELPYATKERLIVAEHGIPQIIVANMGAGVEPRRSSRYLRRLKCAIEGQWKYIWASDGEEELYNLTEDPGEQRNLMPEHPDRAKSLRAKLRAWCKSYGQDLELDGMTPDQRLALAEKLQRKQSDPRQRSEALAAWRQARAADWP